MSQTIHLSRRAVFGLTVSLTVAATTHAQPGPSVGKVTKLTNIETSYPNWSPDGLRIAYQSNRTGNSEIYVMNADGTGAVQLTHHPAVDENPSFSPDGRRIAFRSYRDGNAEIYTMAADGSDVRNLTTNPADDIHPYWTPDGRGIVFNSNRRRNATGAPVQSVFVMRADGSDVRRVLGDAALVEDTYAQFSPDGSRLVFRRRLEEETPGWEQNPGNSEIFIMNADGTGVRRITDDPGFDGWPSWSPDGGWIAFASERTRQYHIYLVRPDGTGIRQLTTAPGNFTKPIFSPDGRRIVCTRTLDGNVEIFVLDLQQTDAAPVVPGRAAAMIARAADAMGGRAVLAALPALTTSYHSLERSLGQEEWPGGPAPANVQLGERTFLPQEQRERLTMRRHMSGGRLYERVLDAGPWRRIDGAAPTAGGAAAIEQSVSAALSAVHPEALLPGLLSSGAGDLIIEGPRLIAGRRTTAVQARLGAQPLTLFFDEADGLLRAAEWRDADATGLDSLPLRAVFSEYRPAVALAGSPRLPHLVELWRGNDLWQSRAYGQFRAAVVGAVAPRPSSPRNVAVDAVEVAPGVVHLRGSDYTSLMVDTGDRIIVVDAPESVERTRAVVEAARRAAGARPISVAITHLHDDHIAGLSAVADFEIIAHESIVGDLGERLRALTPGANPRLRAVSGRMQFGTGDRAFELRAIRHSHADAMLVALMPAQGILFEADLVRSLLPSSTDELVSWVGAEGISVRTVLSSHGAALPWDRVIGMAATWRAGLTKSGVQ